MALPAEKLMAVIEKTVRIRAAVMILEKNARNLSVSELYFRRCFTKYAGMAPHTCLLRQRYLLAVRLLRETDLRIRKIAERCSFPVPRAFFMFFRQCGGDYSYRLKFQIRKSGGKLHSVFECSSFSHQNTKMQKWQKTAEKKPFRA